MATVYHVTTKDRLPSIAEHGLLTRERLETINPDLVTYPTHTRNGVVYGCLRLGPGKTEGRNAADWWSRFIRLDRKGIPSVSVVLRFKATGLVKDRNLFEPGVAREIAGSIEPERIEIKTGRRYVALREFVSAPVSFADSKGSM